MRKLVSAGLVACLIVLTGCSSKDGGAGGVSDEAFCSALEDWTDITIDVGVEMESLMADLSGSDSFDLDSLPTADELHTTGALLLSATEEADDLLPVILANISDPLVASTFEEGHRALYTLVALFGEAAMDADSYLDFLGTVIADYDTFVDAEDSFTALDAGAVDRYIAATCPDLDTLYGGSSGAAYDTSAKADVATLGKEIATYYVDGTEPPDITVEDGHYYFLGDDVGPVSYGNRITDQYYESSIDWCVEITNDFGDLKVFSFSSQSGLQNETCR